MLSLKKISHLAGAAAVALGLPLSAGAVTVEIYDTTGPDVLVASITDNGAGDLDGTLGSLVTSNPAVGGYSLALTTSLTSGFPPLDSLSSTLNLNSGSGSVRVEVSNHFTSGMPNPAQGLGSVTNNFTSFTGSVLSEIYLATSLFGKDSLISSIAGNLSSASATIGFDPSDYYITQVFTVSGPVVGSKTANSEWLAPVPVPAAGLMLLTALGGMVAARRRRKAS